MNSLTNSLVVIATAIIGLAMVVALISKNANTTGVIQSASQGFSGILGTALSPISGGVTMPQSQLGGF